MNEWMIDYVIVKAMTDLFNIKISPIHGYFLLHVLGVNFYLNTFNRE